MTTRQHEALRLNHLIRSLRRFALSQSRFVKIGSEDVEKVIRFGLEEFLHVRFGTYTETKEYFNCQEMVRLLRLEEKRFLSVLKELTWFKTKGEFWIGRNEE